MKKIRMPDMTSTTTPGYENPRGQVVIKATGFPSETFKGQRVYHLRCKFCSHDYGSNGCDNHMRLCPNCQNGVKGERLREAGPGLFDVLLSEA
jgi:hypothetical protein